MIPMLLTTYNAKVIWIKSFLRSIIMCMELVNYLDTSWIDFRL
jgi:hypothetical protein